MEIQNDAVNRARHTPKISIIGAGRVGSAIAYTLTVEQLVGEIVLLDINHGRAQGEALDIEHSVPFVTPTKIRAGDYDDCRDSNVIVITAGTIQKAGENRLDLVHQNIKIMRDIVARLKEVISNAIVLIVSNPVDVLTYAALKLSGLPPERVLGSGTILDTARFKSELSAHCGIDARNIHAYILGEHGDSEVPVWSSANIAGVHMKDFCRSCTHQCEPEDLNKIFMRVKNAAYEIIRLKGSTYYAIALGTARMVEAIIRDQNTVFTASTLLNGQYGLNDVCLSIPLALGKEGVKRHIETPLATNELEALFKSARILQGIQKELKL